MPEPTSFFTDGEAYERQTGRRSRAVGETFLNWLALPQGLRWLDVGCGTGVFTELVLDRCAPEAIAAIDPSEHQIAFARSKTTAGRVDYRLGDAQSLPFADAAFDVAAMALVIFFVPDRAKAIAEMKRVVRPGGTVAAYMWDFAGKAYPQQPMSEALRELGYEVIRVSTEITRLDALNDLFASAGLDDVVVRPIEIKTTFADFDDYWESETGFANPVVRQIRGLSAIDVERLKALLRDRLPTDRKGRISYSARANAVRGRVPV